MLLRCKCNCIRTSQTPLTFRSWIHCGKIWTSKQLRTNLEHRMWQRVLAQRCRPSIVLVWSVEVARLVRRQILCSPMEAAARFKLMLPSASPCGPGVSIPLNGGFCLRTDQTSRIEDLACCQTCGLTDDQRKHGLKKGIIILIAVIAAIAVVAAGFGIWACFRVC